MGRELRNFKTGELVTMLKGYRRLLAEIERLQEEIARLDSRASCLTKYHETDIHTTNTQFDFIGKVITDILSAKDVLYTLLQKLAKERVYLYYGLQLVPDDTFRLLLEYRYIDGMTFEEIALKMSYSLRWVATLHERAIASFEKVCMRIKEDSGELISA